jgi:hypothetical protein
MPVGCECLTACEVELEPGYDCKGRGPRFDHHSGQWSCRRASIVYLRSSVVSDLLMSRSTSTSIDSTLASESYTIRSRKCTALRQIQLLLWWIYVWVSGDRVRSRQLHDHRVVQLGRAISIGAVRSLVSLNYCALHYLCCLYCTCIQ